MRFGSNAVSCTTRLLTLHDTVVCGCTIAVRRQRLLSGSRKCLGLCTRKILTRGTRSKNGLNPKSVTFTFAPIEAIFCFITTRSVGGVLLLLLFNDEGFIGSVVFLPMFVIIFKHTTQSVLRKLFYVESL